MSIITETQLRKMINEEYNNILMEGMATDLTGKFVDWFWKKIEKRIPDDLVNGAPLLDGAEFWAINCSSCKEKWGIPENTW